MQSESDFVAWLDQRDATALARVFDALGGKLLLLAAHVSGREQDAGDLVQATFVAAMARGATWDRERPLWPWLAAILQNEARMLGRRRRRAREVAIDAEPEPTPSDDPGLAAASAEAFEAVVATIDAMPLPYRQVLRLRLVHGLQPIEIARSLEVPVGTVRAQLHRGLAQLRGALPAGIGASIAALLAAEGGLLAAARTQVLDHAAATGAAAAASSAASTAKVLATAGLPWNGKTAALAVAGLVLLSWLAAFAVPFVFDPEIEPQAAAVPAKSAVANVAADSPTSANERQRIAPAAVPPVWRLTVHVEDDAGAPVAEAAVRVWTAPASGSYWNRSEGTFLREELAAGTSDANGDWHDELASVWQRSSLWRRSTRLLVEARAPGALLKRDVLFLPLAREDAPRTVTLQLQWATGIVGRVVGADGRPVDRATIGRHGVRGQGLRDVVECDESGRFVFACEDDPEAWPQELVVMSVEHGTATVAVPGYRPSFVDIGDVMLRPLGAVQGRFVLADSTPIAGYQLRLRQIDPTLGDDLVAIRRWLMEQRRKHVQPQLRDGQTVFASSRGNTGTDGSFAFRGLDPEGTFLLDFWGVEAVGLVVKAGDADVELRVDQQLLTIECVDAAGDALPGASIHLDGFDPTRTTKSWNPHPGFPATGQACGNWVPCGDERGRRMVLSPFGFVWRLYCTDDGFAPVSLRHEALAGLHRATCRIEMHPDGPSGKLHVVAVDEQDRPVPFGVALRALARDLHHDHKRSVMPAEGWTWDLPVGRWRVDAVLGKELVFLHGDGGFARGQQQHEVSIEADRVTELRLVAHEAGLVEFEWFGALPTGEGWRSLRILEAGREVGWLPIDRSRSLPATRIGARPRRFVTRQALAPGMHSFLLTADGCLWSSCDVNVVADALTSVRVEMFAK